MKSYLELFLPGALDHRGFSSIEPIRCMLATYVFYMGYSVSFDADGYPLLVDGQKDALIEDNLMELRSIAPPISIDCGRQLYLSLSDIFRKYPNGYNGKRAAVWKYFVENEQGEFLNDPKEFFDCNINECLQKELIDLLCASIEKMMQEAPLFERIADYLGEKQEAGIISSFKCDSKEFYDFCRELGIIQDLLEGGRGSLGLSSFDYYEFIERYCCNLVVSGHVTNGDSSCDATISFAGDDLSETKKKDLFDKTDGQFLIVFGHSPICYNAFVSNGIKRGRLQKVFIDRDDFILYFGPIGGLVKARVVVKAGVINEIDEDAIMSYDEIKQKGTSLFKKP